MKNTFKFYSFGWILLLGLFNLIAFIVPALPDTEKYGASFWIGYSFITVAFIGQFVCTWCIFKNNCASKMFYNVSLFTTGCIGLAATFVIGVICMAIPAIPYWVSAILCSVVLVANIFVFGKVKIAIDYVSQIDEKVKRATSFIYDMRCESESLISRAKSEEMRTACIKICDAFKYSDPMSKAELDDVEGEIKEHFELFKAALRSDDKDKAVSEHEEILALISERNGECKRLK